MSFELTPELADRIIFGMEDQSRDFVLDTRELRLQPLEDLEEDPADPERFIPLPPWKPVDGYALMEAFVTELRNPVYRERFREILASGRGVFRQFKDALKERRELELLWFRFKEREMRKVVVDWYNAHREAWGLQEVEIFFEETTDLVLSDFSICPWKEPAEDFILEAHRAALYENFPSPNQGTGEELYREGFLAARPGDRRSRLYRAETPGGETAGFLWALREGTDPGGVDPGEVGPEKAGLRIVQLYVLPEYRGLGLARALLGYFRDQTSRKGIYRIKVELAGEALRLADLFREEGFVLFSQVLVLDSGEAGKKEA